MNLIKLILSIQLLLAFFCLLIQIYALISAKWAIFESRVELGLLEEHGHYGLWSICTSRLLAPAEVADDGRLLDHISDCEPMNTLFKPAHSRAFIAVFALAHALALLIYTCLLVIRLVEILLQESNKSNETDLEVNQSQAKRMLVIATRFLASKGTLSQEDNVKRQIRVKLYTISVAAASTSLALLSAITPRKPLRDTDVFQANNVSATNYRVWRGPAFWAQLITLIMDMLVTSLIAIEVRVLFVLQQQQQQITTTCSTNDNEIIDHEVIVNPFFRANSVRSPILEPRINANERHRRSVPLPPDIQETSMSQTAPTRPKIVEHSAESGPSASLSSDQSPSPSTSTNHYVNSKEVRQLKKLMSQRQQQQTSSLNQSGPSSLALATSYSNPLFNENETQSTTSTC